MKVLSLSQSDLYGGASIANYRLCEELRAFGIDVDMYAMRKDSSEEWVYFESTLLKKFNSVILPHLDNLSKIFYGVCPEFSWSLNIFSNLSINFDLINSYDILHVNWIGKNFIPIQSLKKIKIPIVWTLHDSWAYTGGCHVHFKCSNFKTKCGNCYQINSHRADDVSYKLWAKKKDAYKNLDLHFIAPSKWIYQQARKSSLLAQFDISIIPNGLNTEIFKPADKVTARQILNIPEDKKIVLFGSFSPFSSKNKGFTVMCEAYIHLCKSNKKYSNEIIFCVFGSSIPAPIECNNIPIYNLGVINDNYKLACIYSAADFTCVPSISESFCQVAAESMACGTPVLCFKTTGLKNLVKHLINGYSAFPITSKNLSYGFEYLLKDKALLKKMGNSARKFAIENLEITSVAERHLHLYSNLIASKKC